MSMLRSLRSLHKSFQPQKGKVNGIHILITLIGFLIFQLIENEQREQKGYVEKLKKSSPATYMGMVACMIAAIIPRLETIATIPILSNILVFLIPFGLQSEAAALGIFIYSLYIGQGFGWRTPAIIIAGSFVIAPILPIELSLLTESTENQSTSDVKSEISFNGSIDTYITIGFLTFLQILLIHFSLKVRIGKTVCLPEKIRKIWDQLLAKENIVKVLYVLGWTTLLVQKVTHTSIESSFKHKKDSVIKFPSFCNITVSEVCTFIADWFDIKTHLSNFSIIVRTSDIQFLGQLTEKHGSEEMRLYNFVRDQEVPVNQLHKLNLKDGGVGLAEALQKKWVKIETDELGEEIIRLGDVLPEKDETRDNLLRYIRGEEIDKKWIIEFATRRYFSLQVQAVGDFLPFRPGFSISFGI